MMEKSIRPGSLRVEDNKIAMCLEPEWCAGMSVITELWACVGKEYRIKTEGTHWRIMRCVDIDPISISAVYADISLHDSEDSPIVTLTAREIRRCFEEESKVDREARARAEQASIEEGFWRRAGSGAINQESVPQSAAWRVLLGDDTFGKLRSLLESTEAIAEIIRRSDGACTRYPSSMLRRHVEAVKSALGMLPPN